jgi:isoamylase
MNLHDLVSYNQKHNEANKNDNKDGEDDNQSWNCGVEGPTDDQAINALRAQQKRNFLTTLFISQGVPMLKAGDEIGHSKKGNNNSYCQDNEISWLNWEKADASLLEFTQQLINLRRDHPVFSRRNWFKGENKTESGLKDVEWLFPDGSEIKEEDHNDTMARCVAMFFNGAELDIIGDGGKTVKDDNFYILFNPEQGPVPFTLPPDKFGDNWIEVINTTRNDLTPEGTSYKPGDKITVEGRSIIVLHNPIKH